MSQKNTFGKFDKFAEDQDLWSFMKFIIIEAFNFYNLQQYDALSL